MKNNKLTRFFYFIGFNLILACIHAQVSVLPILDTYTQKSGADQSYSSEETFRLKHTFSETNDRISWMKFSTTQMISNSEQILLKLVKVSGNEGNVSIVGTDVQIDNSLTWNNSPSTDSPIPYGGYREGDTCYFDVTDFVNGELDNSVSEIAIKLFTTSIISSSITFASSENSDPSIRPELLFYSSQKYVIPTYDIFNPVTINANGNDYDAINLHAEESIQDARSSYGGWLGATSTATGYFRVEQDCEGAWHMIDPDGYMFYSAGLNSVEPGGTLSLPNDLIDMGLNTMGSWSDESIENFAYCPRFNVLVNYKNTTQRLKDMYSLEILPVFEPDFESFCDNLAQTELQSYLNDPWVLGYFLDNELLFHKDQLTLSLTLLPSTDPQHIAADSWMVNKYGAGYTTNDITEDDKKDYQGYVAETYFSTVTESFREVDANHLLIGTRFHGGAKYVEQIFQAAGNHLDVISVNYYSRFEPEEDVMEMWLEQSNVPFIITEFYVKGNDSGLGNADGAGWDVPTQQDRANWYENWMLKLLRSPGNVGFHWFRFRDKPGNDSNKGLYTEGYQLYTTLANSVEKVSQSIYYLRSHVLYGNYNYNGMIDCNDEICGNAGCLITSLENSKTVDEYHLVPNPVSDLSLLKFTEQTENITVLSSNGVIVFEGTVVQLLQKEIDPGVYFILCIDKEGTFLTSHKLNVVPN